MVEQWASGVSWRDLCRDCSLDQGDLCRILRRTVEALRQIPVAYGVPPALARVAMEAADKMDRFPVADLDSPSRNAEDVSTAGKGFGDGVGVAQGDSEGPGDLEDVLGINFEGDDDDDDDEGKEDADALARLGRFTSKGLKGNYNRDRFQDLKDLDKLEDLDLDKLLGLGINGPLEEVFSDIREVEEMVGELAKGVEGDDFAEAEAEAEEPDEE